MALAVITAIAMQFSLPNRHVLSPTFLFPAVESLLLVALLSGRGTSRIDRWSVARRRVILGLVILMSADNLLAVVELVRDILNGSKGDNGTVLLATGAAVWFTNVIAFSLWFWMLDRGGPTARASGHASPPSFVFATMQSGRLAPADWEPQYLDYLYLAFTNATAFSPTDTMPLTRWAKTLMLAQSAISLVVALMIIARAVSILK
ncbi:MAG TPA: DUF1345 domain-containing protein [Gemmatimonadaceae bacterium]|nr:DUF1345 domain-containing protein [Gemmatimonadaceae bacterium]